MGDSSIEIRLNVLERRVRRTTAAAIVSTAALVACVAVAANPPDDGVLRGRALVLTDSQGRERVTLAAELGEQGVAQLVLGDLSESGSVRIAAGTQRMASGVTEALAFVELFGDDDEGFPYAKLFAFQGRGGLSAGYESDDGGGHAVATGATATESELQLGSEHLTNCEERGAPSACCESARRIHFVETDDGAQLSARDSAGRVAFKAP